MQLGRKPPMTMLYHFVPTNLTGDTLYPLNVLKHVLPEVYAAHVKKYEGREWLLQNNIPLLNCLWNDVLHFTAVHPREVRNALVSVGLPIPERRVFEVNVTDGLFHERNTAIYLYPEDAEVNDLKPEAFVPFSIERVSTLSSRLPDVTRAYYQSEKEHNRRPLLFHRVPHVLYRGSLKIDALNVMTF
jgi:hypothetical protein